MALVTPNQPIHPTLDERISVRVEGQLPAFVKQDHETFIAFMEAYYEYMEQEGKAHEIIGNLRSYNNLDETTDEFLDYFKKQFAEDIPETVFQNSNKPFVLKHIRDFYRAKGSEKAFQFLFRLLYKEEITFYYPGTDLLRTSAGKYNRSQIIRTVDTTGRDMVFTITGSSITGKTSKATAIVEQVLNENIGTFVVSTIFLSGVSGTFQQGEEVSAEENGWSFVVGGMVTDTQITASGNNYQVGDVIPISGGGAGAGGALVEVEELSTGSVMSAVIKNGGSGYQVGDKLDIDNSGKMYVDGRTVSILVKNVDTNGAITKLEIEDKGRGYVQVPTVTGGGSGTGLDIALMGWGVGGIEKLKIVKHGYAYESNPVLDFTTTGDGTAAGTVTASGYEDQYQAGFFTNDGFLSSNKYLQDSFYYQLFSYVITSGENISRWRDIIKRVAHPAGLALFGNIQIISLLDLTMKITGIPQRRHYTIIFHDGDVVPPVILDTGVDICSGQQNIKVSTGEDYDLITAPSTEMNYDFGSITDNFVFQAEDYDLITNTNTFFIAPTKCQTYEQDLGIQKLINIDAETQDNLLGYNELGFIYNIGVPELSEDHGSITQAQSEYEDFGREGKSHASIKTPTTARTERVAGLKDGHHVTQLRLGPTRKSYDRTKFRKYDADTSSQSPIKPPTGLGGLTQTVGNIASQLGQPGKEIRELQNVPIINYALYGGLQGRYVNGTTITRFQTETPPTFNANQQITGLQDQFIRFFHDRPINV